jgi:hypothetical protein
MKKSWIIIVIYTLYKEYGRYLLKLSLTIKYKFSYRFATGCFLWKRSTPSKENWNLYFFREMYTVEYRMCFKDYLCSTFLEAVYNEKEGRNAKRHEHLNNEHLWVMHWLSFIFSFLMAVILDSAIITWKVGKAKPWYCRLLIDCCR